MQSKARSILFLVLTVAALSGSALADPPNELDGPRCLTAVDAHGKTIGTVVDFLGSANFDSETAAVAAQTHGQAFMLYISPEGFFAFRTVLFTTPDCTGTPYIHLATPARSLAPRAALVGPGSVKLYVETPGAIPFDGTFQSVLNPGETCAPGATGATAVQAAFRGTLSYTPPFRTVPCKGGGGHTEPALLEWESKLTSSQSE